MFVQRDGEQALDIPNPPDLQEPPRIERGGGYCCFADHGAERAWREAWRNAVAWLARGWSR
jgi:hypothetical protein